ncbi:putative leucine-rich repeat domain, L domain-containing protein [Rosa chinensis]|uniref:Putative leucine-rich repeat domain, L domain-containing protein n=1 Tax=Rosa chinensis TaxID=74649 RepID=A0A2P6RQC3_ROSCH|nr:disease resistance RPP13-like protein 4 [Rosa chinensis]PRQ48624.1 putative leucine-rich repeat domain, L domain-containing protein [Rosa chinensis]
MANSEVALGLEVELADRPEEISQDQRKLSAEAIFDKSEAMANIRRSYGDLRGTELKVCLLSFSIFPEGSEIRKRPLIYWWIGEGFITATKEKTAEEIGEDIFAKLLRKDLIQPAPGESNCELLVKNCCVHPWIRRMLISLAREARLFDFDPRWPMMPSDSIWTCRRSCLVSKEDKSITPQGDDQWKQNLLTVFNVNVQYLDLKQEWLDKLKRVEVLHFGRWQSSPKYHIEVDQKTFDGSQAVSFLNGLGAQKHLKYLSLRGISRISELPASIRSLISLEILDLRACHDLERLPSDISSLKKLTHLDVSECYLLEGVPKGLHKLSSLQVLKGFLIGSQEKTPTKLGELATLKKLRRLSIHIGNGAAIQAGEFEKLKVMSSLRYLKVSWGVVSKNLTEGIEDEPSKFLFPENLEKLDLQGFPLSDAPEGLKPSKLKNLKKLYIRGGELKSLVHGENEQWKVEIFRLEYLKKFIYSEEEVKRIFPHRKYWTVKNLSEAEG